MFSLTSFFGETASVVEKKVKAKNPSTLFSAGYEIFMALLSLLSIFNMILLFFLRDPSLGAVLALVNFVLIIFFIADFLARLVKSPSKSEYFLRQYGWADFLSCLPFSQTNVFRLFRLIKVYRLLRDFGIRKIKDAVTKDRADTALFILLFVTILMLEFGSLGMLAIESQSSVSNITTAPDALWYMVVTLSTVGYGDQYPVTTQGRVLGAFVILTGVGIFGTLTGYLANFFLAPQKKKKSGDELSDIRSQLDAIKALSAQQQDAIATLEESLTKRET
ncbi:MAG: ion transporter [Actinomycetota bacterium]|nr:ion transporter [Actinomycetota bacterium]